MKFDLPSFAVLIDADQVSQEYIAPILEEITWHARVTERRIVTSPAGILPHAPAVLVQPAIDRESA